MAEDGRPSGRGHLKPGCLLAVAYLLSAGFVLYTTWVVTR